MSRSDFDAMQAKFDRGEPVPSHWTGVGLYRVWVRRVYGRTIFFTGGGHPSSGRGYGFVKGASESPVLSIEDHIEKDWYVAYGYPHENRDVYPTTGRSPSGDDAD